MPGDSVALLIDGDNISPCHAATLLNASRSEGQLIVARVYGDARINSAWHDVQALSFVHTGCGKNAADILLALDALELALTRSVRCFVLASADSDFRPVAIRLRELGAHVLGAGDAKAPARFRTACSQFLTLSSSDVVDGSPRSIARPTDFDRKIKAIIAEYSTSGQGMRLQELGTRMHQRHGLRISQQGVRTWRSYLCSRDSLFAIDAPGVNAMVRFRAEGFANSA